VAKRVWDNVLSFAGYSFCKGHSCSYIQVAQQSCFLRAHYPAEFFAAVLANGGGFYAPFAYVAEAMRLGIRILPPDVNASEHRTTGRGREIRVGLQFVKGLSADGAERILAGRRPYISLEDFRTRTGLRADDLRLLIKVGALDSIAGGMTRPEMLWKVDRRESGRTGGRAVIRGARPLLPVCPSARLPVCLSEYTPERRRRTECELLGFATDCHPMELWRDRLRRFRPVRSTALHDHVGEQVLCAGMLTTEKPVHTRNDEPMQFATFDDGEGLIETVLFPEVYRTRGHVLFDQGPFLFRGKVVEEFGAVTVTVTGLDRVERVLAKAGQRSLP
jgi:error-prone DNA polymerase